MTTNENPGPGDLPNYGSVPPPPPGGAPAPGGYGGPPQQNQKALWSLILGILGLVCCGFFTGVPALILGILAKQEIAASGGTQGGDGLAQAGFILGILAIVMGVITAALFTTGTFSFN